MAFATHWSLAHALGNALGIALFSWLIARRESVRALLTVFALGLAFQIVALSLMQGEYRGASGFLYALATYALLGIRGHPVLRALIGGAGIALVIRDAAGFATSPFLPAGVATAWPIHLAGIAAGVACSLIGRQRRCGSHGRSKSQAAIVPNRPLLKSSTACTISASVFMTNGP